MMFYRDGVESNGPKALALNTQAMSAAYPFVVFGNAKTRTDEPYYGRVSRVRVWNRALSATDVLSEYQDKGMALPLAPTVSKGIVANLVPTPESGGSFVDTLTSTIGTPAANKPTFVSSDAFPGCASKTGSPPTAKTIAPTEVPTVDPTTAAPTMADPTAEPTSSSPTTPPVLPPPTAISWAPPKSETQCGSTPAELAQARPILEADDISARWGAEESLITDTSLRGDGITVPTTAMTRTNMPLDTCKKLCLLHSKYCKGIEVHTTAASEAAGTTEDGSVSIYCILSYACNEGATSYTGGARGGGKVYGWHYTPVTPVGIEVATLAAAPTSKLVTAYHCSANPCACVATKLTRASPTTGKYARGTLAHARTHGQLSSAPQHVHTHATQPFLATTPPPP